MKSTFRVVMGVAVAVGIAACGSAGAPETTSSGAEGAQSTSSALSAVTACVSNEDGPCGGFTQNPCTCSPGLVCVPNRIPDIPGTCEPNRCCPLGWDMYTCNEENGTTGFNCHNPALACASSLVCGGVCDFQVTGRCPVCDPLACSAGSHWDVNVCKCVPDCATAADCQGPLPALCMVCADGGSGCAHWACVNGGCEVTYCR